MSAYLCYVHAFQHNLISIIGKDFKFKVLYQRQEKLISLFLFSFLFLFFTHVIPP
jgi:hypothetical protein